MPALTAMVRQGVFSLFVLALLAAVGCIPQVRAASGLAAAETALQQGAYVDAYRQFRSALDTGPDALRCDALIGLARMHIQLADYNKALDVLQQARGLAERLGDPVPRAYVLLLFARLDLLQTRYARAQSSLADALAQIEQAGSKAAKSEILRWRAELQQRQGDSTAAEGSIREALALTEDGHDAEHAFVVAQQAVFHTRRADYSRALDLWQQTLGSFRALGFQPSEAWATLSLGEMYLELGLAGEALPLFEDALKRFRALADPVGEIRARIRLGHAHMRLNDAERALGLTEVALAAARKRHDHVGEGEALVQLGELWLSHEVPGKVAMPNPDVAIRHFQSALAIYRDAGDRYAAARTYLKVAASYLAARQSRLAARVYEEVARNAGESEDDDTLWRALQGQGRALVAAGDFRGAAQRYDEAVRVLERAYQRTAGLDREVRSTFLSERREVFEEYIAILLKLEGVSAERWSRAFAISELARSRQFNEMLAGAGAERAAAREGTQLKELVRQERQLRSDHTQLAKSLSAVSDSAQQAEATMLRTRLQSTRTALEDVQSRIGSLFPRYSELAQPRPVVLADVQASLGADETLLSYFVMNGSSVVFVIGKRSFRAVTLGIGRQDLRRMVDRYRRPFAEIREIDDLRHWNPGTAIALYEAIVAPVAPFLPKTGQLVIAADDALYTLPFEALLVSSVTASAGEVKPLFRDWAAWPWFGDRHAIGYVPSASALLSLRREDRPKGWKQSLTAFADPDFGTDSGAENALATKGGLQGALLARATGMTGIPRLPETAGEVAAVNKMLGGKGNIFLRGDASEARLYETSLTNTRYLMFSTHGLLGGDFSALGQPALALSLVGNPAGIDGFLSMSEVLGLHLDADITVLSACNTAGEPENARGGEGFAGLTRSFMYAGSRSLVVSHWPVSSEATVALMTGFFSELAVGRSKAAALVAARQKLRKTVYQGMQLAHPFFWAPFVLVGDPR